MVQTPNLKLVKLAVIGDPGGNRTRDNLIKSQVRGSVLYNYISMHYTLAFVPLIDVYNFNMLLYYRAAYFIYGTTFYGKMLSPKTHRNAR